jgi:hypothetical protein
MLCSEPGSTFDSRISALHNQDPGLAARKGDMLLSVLDKDHLSGRKALDDGLLIAAAPDVHVDRPIENQEDFGPVVPVPLVGVLDPAKLDARVAEAA